MMKNLNDLLEHEIQDLYSAETQLIEALPKMEEAASDSNLKKAFREHLKQTEEHKKRLEQVAKDMDINPKGETCQAMKGLIQEGQKMIKEKAEPEVKDAGLIASAQRVEHYEIAAYGTVCTYARMLDNENAAKLLEQTLEEEKNTDKKLTELATSRINKRAKA